MANFLEISHKTPKEMDFSIKNSIFISKKSGKLIKMQQFDQIFHFLFFVPNFLQKNKKFLKSQKQKFFVFVGSHNSTTLLYRMTFSTQCRKNSNYISCKKINVLPNSFTSPCHCIEWKWKNLLTLFLKILEMKKNRLLCVST